MNGKTERYNRNLWLANQISNLRHIITIDFAFKIKIYVVFKNRR
jgi:hypothetical protein